MSIASRFTGTGRKRLVALAGALLMTAAFLPSQASAHFTGVRWSYAPHTYGLLHLTYCNGSEGTGASDASTSSWAAEVDAAANSWTSTWTPLWFHRNSSGVWCYIPFFHSSNVTVVDSALHNPTALASTTWWYDGSGHITSSYIYLNSDRDATGRYNSFGALSRFDQQAVVTHEFGHSFGLAHAGYYAGEHNGAYSIMDYCCYSYDTPRTHDVNDVNALYPGW